MFVSVSPIILLILFQLDSLDLGVFISFDNPILMNFTHFVFSFRIDAAKHISPDNLVAILTKLRNNLGNILLS